MIRTGFQEGIGSSDSYLDFQQKAARCARIDRPVILVGERGTGKELAARRIHYLSARWQKPLITVNLASLPLSLIEGRVGMLYLAAMPVIAAVCWLPMYLIPRKIRNKKI